jgi:hypothetical protein
MGWKFQTAEKAVSENKKKSEIGQQLTSSTVVAGRLLRTYCNKRGCINTKEQG